MTKITEEQLEALGFKKQTNFTIMPKWDYDLGRERFLSICSPGFPNEILYICSTEPDGDDVRYNIIVLSNYDYDGYISFDRLESLIKIIKYDKTRSKVLG